MPKYICYTQIEKIYGFKKNTLSKKYMKGEFIECLKIGNKNYFEVEKIEEWIRSQTVVNTN